MEITEFLLARIAEDEATARACVHPAHDGYKPHPELAEWFHSEGDEVMYVQTPEMLAHTYADPIYVTCDYEGLRASVDDAVGDHIARHDPARVLRECKAKRRIVAWAIGWPLRPPEALDGIAAEDALLRALASAYSDHPDYRAEWAS